MKTFSEFNKEDERRRKNILKAKEKRAQKCIDTMPKTKDKQLLNIRSVIMSGQYLPINLACDKCGSELVRETTFMLNYRYDIICGGCGFRGSLSKQLLDKLPSD